MDVVKGEHIDLSQYVIDPLVRVLPATKLSGATVRSLVQPGVAIHRNSPPFEVLDMRIRNLALNTRQQPRYAHYSQSHNSTTDCIFL